MEEDIVIRLRKRAEIRRNAKGRKSVEEGQPDRLANLLEEAAQEISEARQVIEGMNKELDSYVIEQAGESY